MGKTGLTDALAKKKQSHSGKAKEEAEKAATGSGSAELTRLNVKLPEELHEQFKAQCEAEGRTMTWVVTQFIQDYVSTREDA